MVKNTEAKKQIRREFLKKRDMLSGGERTAAGRDAARRIMETGLYERVRFVYSYVSYGSELDTRMFIEESLKRGKKVAVPRVRGAHRMDFCFIRSLADLAPGYKGIPEPGPWCRMAPVPFEDTLVIVPGTAFDRSGHRTGYGGGFYDAYLSGRNKCIKAAVAHSVQIAEEIPSEETDVQMDMIITEKELIVCSEDCQKIL